MAKKETAPKMKTPTSVKASCEDLLMKGKSLKQAMAILIKRFPDKEEAVLEKSMKYYAAALFKDCKITEEYRNSFVGKRGRGKTADKAASEKEAKKTTAKKTATKKTTAKADAPAKKTTSKKSAAQASGKTSKRTTKKTSK